MRYVVTVRYLHFMTAYLDNGEKKKFLNNLIGGKMLSNKEITGKKSSQKLADRQHEYLYLFVFCGSFREFRDFFKRFK